MKDWRGNEYDVGSTVLYPRMSGRSCEMQEGVVSDIYTAYYCPDDYKWKRLKAGEEAPKRWDGESADTATRVQIKPTRSSRDFTRWSGRAYEEQSDGSYKRVEKEPKAVTILIIDSITAVTSD